MAHRPIRQPITATPASKGFHKTMDSAKRNAAASRQANNVNETNSNATTPKSFMTPHKSRAYIDDSDDDDDFYHGGGAKLTPQPRGVKSEKTIRFQDCGDYSTPGGGASLSAPRPKPQSTLYSKSVAFANDVSKLVDSETDGEHETQSEDDDLQSSNDAETVATSNKTAGTGTSDGTEGSSPTTTMPFSPAYSAITPKATGFTASDATNLVKTAPAHFASRPDSRGIYGAPPPVFDLERNMANLIGQAISRAAQSTPGSVKSAGAHHSPGQVSAQAAYDVSRINPAASPFKASGALISGSNNFNINMYRDNNMTSPGSVTSTIMPHDSVGSVTGVSPGVSPSRLQRRTGYDISWQDLLAQTHAAFEQINLPQLTGQPTTFNINVPASDMLNMLTSGFTTRPAFDLATSPTFEPFIPAASMVNQTTNPVIKIDELPYEAKVSDLIAFVGGNAKILNDVDEPVHIMMERLTAKTGCAYVEFYDFDSAMKVVEKHRQSRAHGKPARINTRNVNVSISSQDQLLKDLFPYAREVNWIVGQPHLSVDAEKFKGFVSDEELITLVRNVEFPGRAQYTKSSPQRSVECLISIIKKLPWYMTIYITIKQRHRIYQAVVDMIQVLQQVIYNNHNAPRNRLAFTNGPHGHYHGPHITPINEVLNEKLLKRLVRAAMGCPGFTPLMKDNIAFISSLDERQIMDHGVPLNANRWRHIYTLIPNPGVPGDVVEYFTALIREETTRMVDALPPSLRRRVRALGGDTDGYFGFFWAVVAYPDGEAFEKMTLQAAADLELGAIDSILGRALPRQGLLTCA